MPQNTVAQAMGRQFGIACSDVYTLCVLCFSAESHENPFQQDGELSKKADFIVRNSTISRTELLIADPDKGQDESVVSDDVITPQSAHVSHAAAPDCVDGAASPVVRPNDIVVRENGKLEGATTPQSVEAEVGSARAEKPETQQAEEVTLAKKPRKCCVVQ